MVFHYVYVCVCVAVYTATHTSRLIPITTEINVAMKAHIYLLYYMSSSLELTRGTGWATECVCLQLCQMWLNFTPNFTN